MYANGRGVPQDGAEAVRWFRLAANQGFAGAQFNLGVMYDTGEGVLQDYVEAHMWTNLAVAQSSGEDRDRRVRNRDNIAAKMTAEQIAEAQRRAREWDAAHPREP
jgi:TPR repeat protein